MIKNELFPVRRLNGVLSEDFGDGGRVLVDVEMQVAHSLEPLAATIWGLADGSHSVEAIATRAGASREAAEATLAEMAELGLLESGEAEGHSRRSVLFRVAQFGGGIVVAGAVINSMALPALAAALSNAQQQVAITYSISTGIYSYADMGSTGTFTTASPIYLTQTGVTTGATPPAAPYVALVPENYGDFSLTLVQGTATNVEAAYGTATPAAEGNLTATQPSVTAYAGNGPIYVAIGT